ncbi:hypothetical protein [Delftia sp. PE138]|uniref:hypothetical protein n=1 Tax=Delftia sp. PE138 TaxID=1812483 RepID=UPI001BB0CF2C|nr:hypothetical protein [Delftia sp. PE138]MBS3721189.1 hypothetical protein [Delftia sp. PE138]
MDVYQWMDSSIQAMKAMKAVPPPADVCWAFWCMNRSEWAAWAQAVFSVLAICVAIAVPLLQHNIAARRENVNALLLAMSVDEQLKDLCRKLNQLAEESENWILKIPGFDDPIKVIRNVPGMAFPSLDDHATLSPLGVKYLQKAFEAAAHVKQTRVYVDSFFSENNQSTERGVQAMWNVSDSAAKAGKFCSIAQKELEAFQRKHRVFR